MEYDLLEVDPPGARDNRKMLLYSLAALLQELPLVTVQGLPTVQRAVVKSEAEDKTRYAPFRLMVVQATIETFVSKEIGRHQPIFMS